MKKNGIHTNGAAAAPVADERIARHAFPIYGKQPFESGVTVREYFAAAALQGLLSGDPEADPDCLVNDAYDIADRMLERGRR